MNIIEKNIEQNLIDFTKDLSKKYKVNYLNLYAILRFQDVIIDEIIEINNELCVVDKDTKEIYAKIINWEIKPI